MKRIKKHSSVQMGLYTFLLITVFIAGAVFWGAIPGLGYPLEPTMIGQVVSLFENGNYINHANNVSFPYGLSVSEGFGFYLLAEIFLLLGCEPFLAAQLVFLIFYVISFVCLMLLCQCISQSKIITLACLTVFFFDPFFHAQRGIPYMVFGILLLPAVLLVEYQNYIMLREGILGDSSGFGWKAILLNIVTKLIFVSMGWYTAVIGAVGTCVFLLIYTTVSIYKAQPKQKRFCVAHHLYLIRVVFPWIISMLIVMAITPSTVSGDEFPMDYYTSCSADVLTLLLPDNNQWISNVITSVQDVLGRDTYLTGDGTLWKNYIGYTMMAVLMLLVCIKHFRTVEVWSLLITGLVGLLLAFGPGIKFMGIATETVPQYTYPLEDMVIVFPWSSIFPKLFPLSMMRATLRWIMIPKVVLIISMGLFAQKIKSTHKWVHVLVACLAIIEFIPTDSAFLYNSKAQARIVALQEEAGGPLKELSEQLQLTGEETAVFLTYDGSTNAFLVPYLCSEMKVNSYTGCTDKSLATAKEYLPDGIAALQQHSDPMVLAHLITELGQKQICDFVIFPYFDMREQNGYWPPSMDDVEEKKAIAEDTEQHLHEYDIPVFSLECYKIFDLRNYNSSCNKMRQLVLAQNEEYRAELAVSGKEYIYLFGLVESVSDENQGAVLKVSLSSENGEVFSNSTLNGTKNANLYKIEQIDKIPRGINKVIVSIKAEPGMQLKFTGLVVSAVDTDAVYQMKLNEFGFSNVSGWNNVIITNDVVHFENNSYVETRSYDNIPYDFFDISMDILIEEPKDINSVNFFSKWLGWQQDMSFCAGMKEAKSHFTISFDGEKSYSVWFDNTLFYDQNWHNLRFVFNCGLMEVYIDDVVVASQQAEFQQVYNTGGTPLCFGTGLNGNIRNISYSFNGE